MVKYWEWVKCGSFRRLFLHLILKDAKESGGRVKYPLSMAYFIRLLWLISDLSPSLCSGCTACLALPPVCFTCSCFRGFAIEKLLVGQRIRMIIIPFAGKALSLGDSELITSLCSYLCTQVLPYQRPILFKMVTLSFSPFLKNRTHHHLTLTIYSFIVCFSLLNVNIVRVGTLFYSLLNPWYLEHCVLCARDSVNIS